MLKFVKSFVVGPVMAIAFIANAVNLSKNIEVIRRVAPSWITNDIPRLIFGFFTLIIFAWVYYPQVLNRINKNKPERKERNILADKLEYSLKTHNHYILSLAHIAGLWAGDNNPTELKHKQRMLVSATRANKIRKEKETTAKVNIETKVYVEDVIKCLRDGKI